MANTQATVEEINAAISLVSALIPPVGALITGLKVIWTASNSGKTDADYIASLTTAAGTLTSDAASILVKDGWVLTDGVWKPPAPTA